MPHAVINGEIAVEDIFTRLNPIFIKDNANIVKTKEFYLSRDKNVMLVEIIIIDRSRKTEFIAMISRRDDGVVVRIYPGEDVEKTDGVKRSLAEIAKQLLILFEESKLGKTNLNQFFS
ncbi:MAG: hypothetical protein ACFFB3_07325 [Candidatus Hodarchaeota archaeon]